MAVEIDGAALRRKLTSVFKQDLVAGDFLYDFSEVLATALYAEFKTALDDLRAQITKKTCTGAFLDKWLKYYNIPRVSGETDDQARLKLARKLIELWGGITVDDMLQLIATSLDMDIADIVYEENVGDDGLYEPARINFTVPDTAFPAGSDIADVSAELSASLNRAAAGGVKVTLGVDIDAATYDGGFVYDDPDTLYGA